MHAYVTFQDETNHIAYQSEIQANLVAQGDYYFWHGSVEELIIPLSKNLLPSFLIIIFTELWFKEVSCVANSGCLRYGAVAIVAARQAWQLHRKKCPAISCFDFEY